MSSEFNDEVRTLSFVTTVKTLTGGEHVDFSIRVSKQPGENMTGSVEFESLPFSIDAIDAVIDALTRARDRVERFEVADE